MSFASEDPSLASKRAAQGQESNQAAGDEDWYDQGFDLGDESNTSYADSYGINPNLLNSATQQLENSRRVLSDANDHESTTPRANQSHHIEGRTGTILVGGNGKIEDGDPTGLYVVGNGSMSDNSGVGTYGRSGSVYNASYIAKRTAMEVAQVAQQYSAPTEESNNDDYSTYVDRSNRSGQAASFLDARFRKARSAEEQSAVNKWEQNAVSRSRAKRQREAEQRQAQLKVQQEREQARIRQQRQQRMIEQQRVNEEAAAAAARKRAMLQAQRNSQLEAQAQRQQAIQQNRQAANQQVQQLRQQQQSALMERVQQAQALMDDASHLRNLNSAELNSSDPNVIFAIEREQALRNSADAGPYGAMAHGPQHGHIEQAPNSAPNAPRPNSEKSLEELAAEYPDMAPENLVKLKRSGNRCHLVSRTPVFDANSNISMYELKFTSGKVFQVNALKSPHVFHVLFGYFIRRGLSCFIGRTKSAFVMMPLTYDFLDYIEHYSVSRVVLRICPEQPVTPSALHILTKLRRAGMSFAIDLMSLLKKDWSKAVLSIEYVMIDLSQKVSEQLGLFSRIKAKAPWLKTIGYNDPTGAGYAYLMHKQIDLYNGPYWSADLNFVQDTDHFRPVQQQMVNLVTELFKSERNYTPFLRFLRNNESITRDAAVFLYRYRHASPRQVQNVEELYSYLLNNNPDRCFSVLSARAIMLTYAKSLDLSSQKILQEHYVQALVRGYFVEYMAKIFNDHFVTKYAFPAGMFSLLHLFLLKEEMDVIADDSFAPIFDRIYAENDLLADIIECISAIENTDLSGIFTFIQKHRVPPASVLVSYEKSLMRTNELLLVLNIVTSRK